MCKLSNFPPWLILVGPLQAPINWLLFMVVVLVLLRWFTQTYTSDVSQHTSHDVRPRRLSLLFATYTILLVCSFLVFIVAPPSLQILNHWFKNQVVLLSQTCEPYTDQYVALNHVTAQVSHVETFSGLLASGGLIIALICMRQYVRARRSQNEGSEQPLSLGTSLSRNAIFAMGFLIATNVVYALSPVLDGAGCDESCGFEVLFIGFIGSVIGVVALLVTLIALIRGFSALAKRKQWIWLAGLLLLLAVSIGFFLNIQLGPRLLTYPSYPFDLFRLLDLPQIALIFTVLTFLPTVLLLSLFSSSEQDRGKA